MIFEGSKLYNRNNIRAGLTNNIILFNKLMLNKLEKTFFFIIFYELIVIYKLKKPYMT